ncbi:hypothetical protein SmJEL517_g02106 [Synchytrium microbalum]|uniref:Aminotransferase class I/classII large domain-containing protein n=1 Tax=Synchytrium microbalum TaxID=1806994 RepID=A0A507CDH6_9FUNG|nr:uncharacterized protein SmJEL517_g02106 [Synchytrium microbalum]TPX35593.1 hypothetical protein SmJEL517_g02106 [Synchytrium microbalum]
MAPSAISSYIRSLFKQCRTSDSSENSAACRSSVAPVACTNSELSAVARELTGPSRISFLESGRAKLAGNPYTRDGNPGGIINVSLAENYLMYDVLLEKMNKPGTSDLSPKLLSYQSSPYGTMETRTAICSTLTRELKLKNAMDPTKMTLHAGAGAVLQNFFQAVCDPGDGVLVPAPYYVGFERDISAYTRAKLIAVHFSSASLQIDVTTLEEARKKAEKEGIKIKSLLLTNPHNPFGTIYNADLFRSILVWAASRKLHVLVDEVYALSRYDQPSSTEWVSILDMDLPDPTRTHLCWAASKDLCANGVRLGAFYTFNNPVILKAMQMLCIFARPSSLAEAFVRNMLADETWFHEFVVENAVRLKSAYERCTSRLKEHSIPFVVASSAFFIWIDLRRFMKTSELGSDPELTLWHKMIDGGGLAG